MHIELDEALQHAGMANDARVKVVPIEAEEFEGCVSRAETRRRGEKNLCGSAPLRELKDIDGILVPGGFGSRGVEGLVHELEALADMLEVAFDVIRFGHLVELGLYHA